MNQDPNAAPAPQAPDRTVPHIHLTPSSEEGLKLYAREIATYLRELPRLLEEGYAWKHALVKDDAILSVWDTQNDAIQAGVDRFGLDPIFVKTIDPRDSERFGFLKAQLGSSCPF
jgi:hypothetical protein